MADLEIKDFVQVVTPALTDVFVCQQSGVTLKITASQILGLISVMSNAGALAGTETTIVRQSSENKKATLASITDYILEQA